MRNVGLMPPQPPMCGHGSYMGGCSYCQWRASEGPWAPPKLDGQVLGTVHGPCRLVPEAEYQALRRVAVAAKEAMPWWEAYKDTWDQVMELDLALEALATVATSEDPKR